MTSDRTAWWSVGAGIPPARAVATGSRRRPAVLALLLSACASDPTAAEAWHGPVRIDSVLRSEAVCDAGTEPFDPVAPFLFTAVLDGGPPLASLYWCETAEGCPPGPFVTVDVSRLTFDRLEGLGADTSLSGDTCAFGWDRVEATQQGDRVTLTWRTFRGEDTAGSQDQCDALLDEVVDVECDEVLTFEGARVE